MKLIVEMDYDEGRVKLSLPQQIEKLVQGIFDNTIITVNNTAGLKAGSSCSVAKNYLDQYDQDNSREIASIDSTTRLRLSEAVSELKKGGRILAPLNETSEFQVMRVANIEQIIESETKSCDILIGTIKGTEVLYDYTVEHGETYEYYLLDNVSRRVSLNTAITVDFEDLFLTDYDETNEKIRQLRVKYNPKVSSLKTVIQETKTDTIGGKFPFFFRNGNIGYKEIPISGLLETGIDEQGMFAAAATGSDSQFRGTTAASAKKEQINIIARERKFKLAVEKWLRNGKAKLFRSGPEGSYIVRLMNVSLSPNDTLGRRLHTFSSTGYEIKDATIEEYKEMGLYKDFNEAKEEAFVVGKTLSFELANSWHPIYLSADNDNIVYFTEVTYQASEENSIMVLNPEAKEIQTVNAGSSLTFTLSQNSPDIKIAIYQGTGTVTCTYTSWIGG